MDANFGGSNGRIRKGVATAVVTANDDPEKRGRVKLQYPWARELGDSGWVRVATIGAGKGYGFYFVPEVGDEVLISFAGGDVERPFVIGTLWNGKDKPVGGSKPEEKWIRSKGKNVVIISDEQANGRISITTAKGHTVSINDKDGSEKIVVADKGGKNGLEVDITNKELKVNAEMKLSLSATSIEVTADADLSLTSNGTLSIQGTMVTIN
jgi:uncharacterized protein involved in type VI secretion and phage assembly